MKPTYKEALEALIVSYWLINEVKSTLTGRHRKLLTKAQDNLSIVQTHFAAEPAIQMEIALND